MRRPRALLFDLDGVLIDSYEVWFRLQNALAERLGRRPITRARFRRAWGQGIEDDIRAFYPGSTVAEVEAYYERHFMDHLRHLRVTPGAPETLDRLREIGCPTCVITNTPSGLARRLLEHATMAPDFLVGGTDVPSPKPAPDMVQRAADLLGLETDEVAVIGDSIFDEQAARAAGARFIGFGIDGDVRVESLEEIPALVGG